MPLTTPKVQYDQIVLRGGLDLITPTLSLPSGAARDAVNFECSVTGGYTRIAGYERFDGRASPSGASYGIITVNLTSAVSAGQTVTGGTSGATGVVIAIDGNSLVYTKSIGTFTPGENLLVSAVVKGTVTALSSSVNLSLATQAQYQGLAADAYRQDIGVVPGSGPVRGIAYFNDVVYAWRDNAGGTALILYKSTASGWSQISLGSQITFDTGTSEIVEGLLVVGATSGATAIAKRVIVESGTWAAGTAAGRIVFASVTGTFQSGEILRTSSINRATCRSAQAAITLQPGGRVETVVANFGGSTATTRLYGCDGINEAFEFDGETYATIKTGMSPDRPTHVAFHKNHLFLSFGSSVQFSSIGEPFRWSPVFGAGEIALIDNVTSFLALPGDQSTGAIAIFSDDHTFILYGTSEADFNLVSYNVGTGAKPYSTQNMTQSYVFDDRGVMNLQTTLNYGNFDTAALTLNIRPFVQQRRNLVTGSCVNREKSQYRVFFSDGAGLYLTVANGQYMGAMPVQFPNAVSCICEGEKSDGAETSLFGSTNGYVYRLDAGTSFDGQAISANLTLMYNPVGSPRMLKRWRKASLEVNGSAYSQFSFSYSLAYGSSSVAQGAQTSYQSNLVSSYWDAANWDSFVWDGVTLAPTEVEVDGTSENIALQIVCTSPYFEPFTINSAILHYTVRRGLR